jgi:hypothetical protein
LTSDSVGVFIAACTTALLSFGKGWRVRDLKTKP